MGNAKQIQKNLKMFQSFKIKIVIFARKESGQLSKFIVRLYTFLGDSRKYTLSIRL